jgi:hypothetical protein
MKTLLTHAPLILHDGFRISGTVEILDNGIFLFLNTFNGLDICFAFKKDIDNKWYYVEGTTVPQSYINQIAAQIEAVDNTFTSNGEVVRATLLKIQAMFPDSFNGHSIFEFIDINWNEPVMIHGKEGLTLDENVKKEIEQQFHVSW